MLGRKRAMPGIESLDSGLGLLIKVGLCCLGSGGTTCGGTGGCSVGLDASMVGVSTSIGLGSLSISHFSSPLSSSGAVLSGRTSWPSEHPIPTTSSVTGNCKSSTFPRLTSANPGDTISPQSSHCSPSQAYSPTTSLHPGHFIFPPGASGSISIHFIW